jgi:hypothetical protein
VRVRAAGRQRLYGLDARGLQPVHEWVIGFEQYWNENFDRLSANRCPRHIDRRGHSAESGASYPLTEVIAGGRPSHSRTVASVRPPVARQSCSSAAPAGQ